jgi:hypothetical protein
MNDAVEREMPAPDDDARMRRRDQRERDADVRLAAEQAVRIAQPEREAQQRRDGAERDVALLPGEADAEPLDAVVHVAADDADVGDRAGVGAGVGAGQREARNLEALREPRQVVLLLFVGAVVEQQFRGAERVGDHDRHALSVGTG